jgi:hypothetical protein
VVVTVSAAGAMLVGYIIFKGLKKAPNCVYPPNVVATASKSGTMNTELMADYLDKIIKPVVSTQNGESLMLLDQFRAHSTAPVMEKFRSLNVKPLLIPGGFTHCLQPLDVSINKPLKEAFKAEWSQWMIAEQPVITRGGNRQRPSYQKIVDMLGRSLDRISPTIIRNSFGSCGLAEYAPLTDQFVGGLNPRLRQVLTGGTTLEREKAFYLGQLLAGGDSLAPRSSVESFSAGIYGNVFVDETPMLRTRPKINRRFSNAKRAAARKLAVNPTTQISPTTPAVSSTQTTQPAQVTPPSPFSMAAIMGSSSPRVTLVQSGSPLSHVSSQQSYITTDYSVSKGFSDFDYDSESPERTFTQL